MFSSSERASKSKVSSDAAATRVHRDRATPASPATKTAHRNLQRTIGNQATLRLLAQNRPAKPSSALDATSVGGDTSLARVMDESASLDEDKKSDVTENTSPTPEPKQKAADQEGAQSDQDGENDGELSLVVESAVAALSTESIEGVAGADSQLIQRQPKSPKTNQSSGGNQNPSQVVVLTTNLPQSVVGQTKKGTDGETSLTFKPDFKWKMKNGKITSYSGTLQPAIQTTYLSTANPKGNSAYGRGTTSADKTAGNTTLEFHESMHVEDYKTYLASHPLPEFKVKVSPTEAEFRDAANDYAKALQKYSEDASEASKQSTDCVGVKEATCK